MHISGHRDVHELHSLPSVRSACPSGAQALPQRLRIDDGAFRRCGGIHHVGHADHVPELVHQAEVQGQVRELVPEGLHLGGVSGSVHNGHAGDPLGVQVHQQQTGHLARADDCDPRVLHGLSQVRSSQSRPRFISNIHKAVRIRIPHEKNNRFKILPCVDRSG